MNIIFCNLIHIVLCTNSKYDVAWRQGGAGGRGVWSAVQYPPSRLPLTLPHPLPALPLCLHHYAPNVKVH